MASSVQILCPNGRRQNVKVTPNTKLLQVGGHNMLCLFYHFSDLSRNYKQKQDCKLHLNVEDVSDNTGCWV